MFGYTVNTDVVDDKIVQEVIAELGCVREVIARQVLDTQERQIRDALIKLGWTPPPAP